ncbi:MAG: hypothetical protein ACJ707_08655 [Nitrososphaera sp.]
MSFRTTEPADDSMPCLHTSPTLTFDAHGTASSDNQSATITGGTFQITDINDAQRSVSGSIHRGQFTNNSEGGSLGMIGVVDLVHHFTEPCILEGDMQFAMSSGCSTLNLNYISINFAVSGNEFGDFHGEVACSQGGGIQSTAGTHKIVMVMEYLTQVIGVLIPLTQDASKKLHSIVVLEVVY